jgi:hypothetical protein
MLFSFRFLSICLWPPFWLCIIIVNGPWTWWLEGAGGTPQVGGSTPGLGLKKSHLPIPLKAHGKDPAIGRLGCGPLCMGGWAKHKLRTGPWVVLTGYNPCVWVDAGFVGFSRSVWEDFFLVEYRGGGHSPTGRVFDYVLSFVNNYTFTSYHVNWIFLNPWFYFCPLFFLNFFLALICVSII